MSKQTKKKYTRSKKYNKKKRKSKIKKSKTKKKLTRKRSVGGASRRIHFARGINANHLTRAFLTGMPPSSNIRPPNTTRINLRLDNNSLFNKFLRRVGLGPGQGRNGATMRIARNRLQEIVDEHGVLLSRLPNKFPLGNDNDTPVVTL
tara:strand:+ start:7057 stop:7500 length:444 start_codon:yes stop_codon:yes gene_type:complete